MLRKPLSATAPIASPLPSSPARRSYFGAPWPSSNQTPPAHRGQMFCPRISIPPASTGSTACRSVPPAPPPRRRHDAPAGTARPSARDNPPGPSPATPDRSPPRAQAARFTVVCRSIAAISRTVRAHRVRRVEQPLLVLLQIAVVGHRQALQQRQQRDQIADHPRPSCRASAPRRPDFSSAASATSRSCRRRRS